jgi:hypothetical protein
MNINGDELDDRVLLEIGRKFYPDINRDTKLIIVPPNRRWIVPIPPIYPNLSVQKEIIDILDLGCVLHGHKILMGYNFWANTLAVVDPNQTPLVE